MNTQFGFIKSAWFKITLLLIAIQQIFVASGTYLLGELSREFSTNGFNTLIAILLFICISLPGTIIHYWVVWFTTRASKAAQLNYINLYINSNSSNPTHWRSEKSRHVKHDIMCRSGQDAIQSSIFFFTDLAATALNIILNTISIVLVTNLIMAILIITAGLLGLSVIHFYQRKISSSSRNEILADNQLNSHLSRSWDNIILGNSLHFKRWNDHFKNVFDNSEKASLQVIKNKDKAVSFAALVTNVIVLGGALILAWFYQNYTGFVLGILVMLPRSLQIVMHIQIIQSYIAKWRNIQEKLQVVQESLSKSDPLDLNQFIKEKNISINVGSKKYSIEEIENFIDSNCNGRITITGSNGSGKSSLLLKWKSKHKLNAVYIPAQHNLMINTTQVELSSGEIALKSLFDINTIKENIVLLDEWDANLSHENRTKCNIMIEELSKEKIIIEIRHSE